MSGQYLRVFLITLLIFIIILWLSNSLSNKRLTQLRDLEDKIGLNILSTETRFSLLEKTACEYILDNKDSQINLNAELSELAKKVKFMESQLGADDQDVVALKEYYTLLQIKDYLLMQELHSRCREKTVSILYFHSADCTNCARQSLILDKITMNYPEVRVYWLDKDTNTPALKTLTSLFKINSAPTLVINEKVYLGLQDFEQIESYIPEIKKWKEEKAQTASSTATTNTME